MNRKDFLSQLEQLLSDIPQAERQEALAYYENYFEDAGPEKEAQIIEELGPPSKVAESIKKDLFGENYQEYAKQSGQKKEEELKRQQQENKVLRNILIVVALVLTFPIWIGLLGGAVGLVFGIVGALFGLSIAAVLLVAAFLIVGIVLFVAGIVKMLTGLGAVGCLLMAVGLFILALGILGLLAVIWVVGRILPWLLRAVVRICKKPFQKRGAAI